MSLAADVIHTAVDMNRSGINSGSSGNVSARHPDGFLITPTGMAYGDLETTDLVLMSLSGAVVGGTRRPSSEWQFHRDIYASRPEFGAIVHVHSRAATALAVASLDGSMARLDRFRRELRAVARGELALDDFVALALSPAYFGEAGRGRADRRRHDAVATEAGHRGARASDSDGNTRSPVVTSDRADPA